jgi:thiol-disulfide isomerase/thioredoxin
MKAVFLGIILTVSSYAGLSRVGDPVPNMCWEDSAAKKHCLSDFKGKTAVLLYNAGWCGPCNSEFKGLPSAVAKYAGGIGGHEVVFLSLSCEGWSSGSAPSGKFLEEWKAKHGLGSAKADFLVLASPRDCGREFFTSGSIPNVAIIAETGHLNYKGIGPSLKKLVDEIDQAMKP